MTRIAVMWVLGLTAFSGSWAQRLVWLGQLPGGLDSEALGVSADGSVVVGTARNSEGFPRAFRWTASTAMQDLGTLGGVSSRGMAVSADGHTIVGLSSNDRNQLVAFRWRDGRMEPLRPLGNVVWCEAYGVSADGSVIAGFSWWGSNFIAVRWQGDTVSNLGTLSGAIASRAWGVSGNGQVIVGAAFFPGSEARAVRWQGTTIQSLGELAGYRRSWALAASHDGSVIVGYALADNNGPSTSIRWVNGQPQSLGWLPINGADGSIAYSVSGDGAIVVGSSDGRAYRWTATRGMENLNQVYASLLRDGSRLHSANAISADGRFIVGAGYNASTQRTEAFLLDTATCAAHNGDVDQNGCVNDADLLAVLFAFGASGDALGRVDVNCDQTVNDSDLLIVLFNFGTGC